MADTKARLVAGWLAKAEEDITVARLLIRQERRLYSAAVYHCQQAAEKALKAWLTAHETLFPKTHDLEFLLNLCAQSGGDFNGLVESARELTPMVTEFRYPGEVGTPSVAEAEGALLHAEAILSNVIARMSRSLGS